MVEIEFTLNLIIGEVVYIVIISLNVEMMLHVCKSKNFYLLFAFRGMNMPENNSLGACATGYQGVLCTDCEKGYSRTGTYECSLCPDNTSNSFKLIGLLIIIIIALVMLIRSTIAGALE